ncbi:MAG: DUF4215 domain-containing protein, partial [Myxococcales bacterium]|nr:DUF4215 domain-containing protein [Myxococcales bacterium]
DNADDCLDSCVAASCGDLFVQAGVEDCDEGAETATCDVDCTAVECGDALQNAAAGEVCDDGNTEDGDGCSAACTLEGCGDGQVQAPEECDDGNADNTDDCLDSCVAASCGDSNVWAGNEECDDGNADNTDDCLDSCVAASCGDGNVQAGVEECDDGNADNTDGCVDGCVAATCGDGFVQAGVEECDDGNNVDNDACSNTCKAGCGAVFSTNWCLQQGTMMQYTRCQSVTNGGNTCNNPEIKYGNIEGGIPRQHGGNQFPTWCQQLGFSNWSGQVSYGNRPCLAPQGGLFGCTSYDENTWHWCDWQDGDWYNEQLDWHNCGGTEITSITCTP